MQKEGEDFEAAIVRDESKNPTEAPDEGNQWSDVTMVSDKPKKSKKSTKREDKRRKGRKKRKKERTERIVLDANKSDSDVKDLCNSVSFEFYELRKKERDPEEETKSTEPGDTPFNKVMEFVAEGMDPKNTNDGKEKAKKKKCERKKLLELNSEQLERMYKEAYDSIYQGVDDFCSKGIPKETDDVPLRFGHVVKKRLMMLYVMLSIDENMRFYAKTTSTCNDCERGNSPSSNCVSFVQCDRCAEKDCLKLLSVVEFYALAIRHQKSGTVVSKDPIANEISPEKEEKEMDSSVERIRESDTGSSDDSSSSFYSSDSSENSEEYEKEEEEERKEHGNCKEGDEERATEKGTVTIKAQRTSNKKNNKNTSVITRGEGGSDCTLQ